MTSKEYVEKLDWQSAIAAATLEIDDPNYKPPNKPSKEESYFYRGMAYCFIADKEAIEDLSKAIVLLTDKDKAYYYRAYAYYLDSNYEKAIEDCNTITNSTPTSILLPYIYELLGKIHHAMNSYEKAADKFKDAMKEQLKGNPITPSVFPPCLMDSYREACKRMKSV